MLPFFIIGVVAGILLGLRFNVFILVPACLLVIVGIVVLGGELRWTVLTAAGTVVLLQVGYFFGSVLATVRPSTVDKRE